MNQPELYRLKIELHHSRERLLEEARLIVEAAAPLPYCPCCPQPAAICAIDFLRRDDSRKEEQLEIASRLSTIPLDRLRTIRDGESSFTDAEWEIWADHLANNQRAMNEARVLDAN